MDLQKDEDFEKAWQENRHIWESTKNLAKAMFYAGQAKAHTVPDGFVLIPKKLPDELNDQLWDFMTDNFVCVNDYGDSFMACDDFDLDKLYATLIEAQEPK